MFEEYLRDYHVEHESDGVLGDYMPGSFDSWITELEPHQWIELADKYMDEKCASYLGKRSASKRDTSSEKMKELVKKRWNKKALD